jgi:hypothetical protein
MLFAYELKKLLFTPAIIGFLALCLIVNAAIAITGDDGGGYGDDREETIPANVFEDYRADDLAEMYIRKYGAADGDAENIRAKYARLQTVIDKKAADGDALSRYFGEGTYYRHGLLFGTLFTAMIAESCLLALFLALLSVTWENARNTEQTVFSSKAGRRVMRVKLAASLMAAVAVAAVVLAVGLFVFFARFGYWRDAWDANVSSGFNFTVGEHGKPFIAWRSFTVAAYLRAMIGAAFPLAVCFCLLGYGVGLSVRNGYGAFIAAVAVVAALAFTEPLLPTGSVARGALNLSPVGLWRNSEAWFTDGGANILWANFETLGLATSLAALSLAALIAGKVFKRRELL